MRTHSDILHLMAVDVGGDSKMLKSVMAAAQKAAPAMAICLAATFDDGMYIYVCVCVCVYICICVLSIYV